MTGWGDWRKPRKGAPTGGAVERSETEGELPFRRCAPPDAEVPISGGIAAATGNKISPSTGRLCPEGEALAPAPQALISIVAQRHRNLSIVHCQLSINKGERIATSLRSSQ